MLSSWFLEQIVGLALMITFLSFWLLPLMVINSIVQPAAKPVQIGVDDKSDLLNQKIT